MHLAWQPNAEQDSRITYDMGARDTFWSIPPIQDAIAQHLERKHLLKCITISKLFHTIFIPFLWRKVYINKRRFLTSAAQPLHRHHVDFLIVHKNHVATLKDHLLKVGPFPNLRQLTFNDAWDQQSAATSTSLDLLAFAAAHPSLERLQWVDVKISSALLESLLRLALPDRSVDPEHPKLRHLKLNILGAISCQDLARLLRCAKGLEEFFIISEHNYTIREGGIEDGLDIFEENLTLCAFECTFSFDRGTSADRLLAAFLRQCPQLGNLELYSTLEKGPLAGMLMNDLQKLCPRLRMLAFPTPEVCPLGLIQMLKTCPILSRFRFCTPLEPRAVIGALCERHGGRLTEVNGDFGTVTFEDLFRIGMSCPLLKTLDLRLKWREGEYFVEEVLATMRSMAWQCRGLRRLCLCFPKELTSLEVYDCFFQQLGQLTRLESMTLFATHDGRVGFVEGFSRGLGYLSGLKRMHWFYLSYFGGTGAITVGTLEQIVEQWPRLEHLGGLPGFRAPLGMTLVEAVKAGKCIVEN